MGFRLRLLSRTQISRWTVYALFSSLFITLPAGVITAPKAFAAACNPTSTTLGAETILTFSTTGICDWSAPAGVSSVRVLVVGGGGSGGGGYTARYFGNGGGGGEVIETTTTISQGATISIAVGSGGVGPNYDTNSTSVNNGANSSFQSITARGGTSTFDKNSRIGGTSGSQRIGGTGGNTATEGGGGGGAGAAGSTRNGGVGVTSSISGSSVEYGGGGAAMGYGTVPEYGTASGGGGVPATYSTNVKGNGVNGRGGGGGGDNGVAGGGAGGSGVVIVRYTILGQCTSTTSTVDTQTIVTFTAVQNCDWLVPFGVSSVRALVVGGGGGGAGGVSGVYFGAGGGGGEVIASDTYATTPGGTVAVTVGGGGIASTYNTTYTGADLLARHGSSSAFGTITARGGKSPTNANSIGGASGNTNAGGSTAGGTWGNAGGGASAAANGGIPGAGVTSNISGTTLEYGGGGDGTNGSGSGSARSGAGSQTAAPLVNRGGGGAVLVSANYGGSAGGSGVVIVRFTTVANTNPILYFNSNGGTGSVAARSETAGVTITLPSGTALSKRNSVATGWNTLANGSGTPYAFGDSFTITTNATLYAQWSGPVLGADLAAPQCTAGVGIGGSASPSALPPTKGGNGCVVVSYLSSGTTAFKTFNYTGASQNWTVPAGVTSATFYVIGAGGGGATQGTGTGTGGGGGYATGRVAVTAGSVFEIIVGEAGGGVAPTNSGSCSYTPRTFGGGGKGGACYQLRTGMMASGGGRSAVRVSGAANDLITAAGGGGGGYQGIGGAGGGLVGQSGTVNTTPGGSQTAGGAGGYSINGFPGFAGTKYQGGDSRDESGGGGGGYWGGGGGGDNGGGGGGSSFIDSLTVTSGSTTAGSLTTPGTSTGLFNIITYDANGATSGSVPSPTQFTVTGGTRVLETNTAGLVRTGYTLTGWNTQANGRGASYNLADTTFNTSTDITLYAEWSYTITYRANGATSGTAPAAVTMVGDSTTTLAINPGTLALTRGVLRGWNTEADGSGTAYPGGQTNFSNNGNITLYAMWGPASCTPNAGYSNCAVFPMSNQDLFYKLPNNVPVGTIMQAEIWGAGGGVNESGATGGGGGGYSRVQIEVKAVGETFTVVTGNGGTRGDTVGTYGGGGGTSRNSYWGSSGGGMSGIFSGEGLNNPIVISGGGGGASPGHNVGIAGGGGAAGNPGNQRGNASDYAIAGAPGTLIAGGAAATNTSPCDGVNATAGSKYQGGRGAGGNTANGTESGGGGGGGYFGGGGGRCQVSSGPVQNGGGGGGSGFFDSSRVTRLEVVNGSNAIAGAGPTGGTTSAQYIAGIGLGGGISNSGAAGDGLVVLQWGTETYTVTFDGNGGTSTAPSVSQVVVGGTVTVADSATATRTGYTFLGWNTLATGLGSNVAVGAGYLPPSNITLYAKWSANNYVVVFDSNTATGVGATGTMANMAIVAGTAKALTTNGFSRTGYVFRNWNSRADGTGTSYANLASITVYETTTVYAQWNPILTYNINGGTGTVPVAVNVPPGTNVAAPSSTITRTGFTFAGWNTTTNRTGTAYLVGDSITVTVPTTVYAMWKLTVTYNGNSPTTGSAPSALTVDESTTVTLPGNTGALVKTGFIFVGWNTVLGGTGTRYLAGETFTPTANIILYADWIAACSPTTSYGNGDQLASMRTAGTCAYTIPSGVTSIDFLVVGGGGGGGTNAGSGGGGGGLVYRTAVPVTPGQVLIVTTGAGGGTGANGNPSMVVLGGVEYRGRAGAGAPTYRANATAICTNPSFPRPLGGEGPYANGGLGGNGAANTPLPGCNGDTGTALSITGTSVVYGSGGGGGGYGGAGGLAGAGAGNGGANYVAGGAGAANTGGGGGGGGAGNAAGGAGGSGVVVIAFDYTTTINYDSNTATSGSITTTTWTQSFNGEPLTIQSKGTLAKLGYSFTGWNTAANGSGTMHQPGALVTPQGPTTYYAIWVADTFTVTFDANNGTGTIASQLYTAAVAQTLTNNTTQITRTGFTFGGWSTNADGTGTSYTNAQSITLYAGITLYAKWTANTYTVYFGSNTATGPATMANQTFSAGTPFNLSANVWYKTGHDFIGWSATAGTQSVLYTDKQSVTLFANTNIYAQWQAAVYQVTYNNNGGNGQASIASQNYTYGTAAITSFATVGAMTRTGYTFGGWATTPTGTAALTTLTPTANQILYAIWTPRSFNIVFNGNTSTSGTMANLAMVSGTAKALTANAFLKTGFGFTGWNTVANGSGISYVDTQTITLFSDTSTVIFFAQWRALRPATPSLTALAGNETATITVTSSASATTLAGAVASYTVTALDASGNPVPGPLTCTVTPPATSCVIEGLTNGTAYKFSVVANNSTGSSTAAVTSTSVTPQPWVVTYSVVNGGTVSPTSANFDIGSPVSLPLPVRAGYTFTGWFTAASGGTLLGLDGAGYTPPSNITVYAQWTGISYPITYNSNGGTSTVPAAGNYATGGSAYPIAAAPGGMTKVGYTFAGWNTLSTGLGTDYAAASQYSTSAALTLFAKWSAINYTVTYANSGSGTGTLPTHPAMNIGQTFAVASGSALSNPGYTFTGWFDGTKTYVTGESYTVASSNVSFTAVWTALQYLVIYSANGGAGTAPTEGTRSSGQTFIVAAGSALSRTGYSFAGWSESSTAYAVGDTFTMPTRNVTLVAQWTPAVFTVTYVAGLGTGNASRATDAFTYGGSAISLPAVGNMTYPGFVFNGWAETSTVISGAYTPTRSETLTAQWIPGTYAITYNTNGATGSPTGAPSTYTTSQSGLTLPGATGMTNPGYTLAGWSTTPNGAVISGTFSPTANTTLYAIWTPAQVNLNFAPGEVSAGTASGAAISTTSLTRAFDSQYTLPAIDSPTVEISTQVYAFTGWKSSNGIIYAPGSSYTVEAAGTTFTAQWIQQFVVTYVLNGGTAFAGDLVTDGQCVSAGNMCSDQQVIATNNTPTRDGYTFTGWLDQGGTSVGANSAYTVSVNHYVLSAQWTPVSVNVVYAAAGGDSTPSTQTQSYLGSITLANAISRTGYTFAGWSDGTLTYGAGANYRIESSTAITMTALWTSNIHTVSYDLNRGTSGTSLVTTSFNFGTAVTITTTVPTRTGYDFAGWLFGSITYESTTAFSMPDLDVTFTAQWSAKTFPVTYALNGGNSTLPIQASIAFGSTFTVAAAPTNPDSTVTFLGWSDGTNIVAAGSTYTMPANGITLTAQWSGALVGVTYVISGATSGTAPATQIVPPSTAVVVASGAGISKDRYVLDGWSTGNTTVEPSSTIAPVVNTTLVAVWVAAAPDAPVDTPTATNGAVTIAVGQGAGSGGAPTSYTVTAIDSVTGLTAGTCTVISPATTCTIAGLTNGTPYKFTTVATNSSGTSAATVTGPVTPATIPSAPTSPVATVENGQATVSFTAPANTAIGNGGSPITSYTVTAYGPDGITVVGTCTATPPATSCLITGLTNGTAYTYGVVANNAAGSSPSSTKSAPVTPATVPGAPATLSASAATATTATVSIGAATVTGGSAITAYDITATPVGGGTPITLTVTAAQISGAVTLTGLAPGTQYTITSNATNVVGDGATTTAASTITTPAAPPGAPSIATAAATSTTAATITINAPSSNGGATITGYTTTLTPLGGGNAIVETSTGTTVSPSSLAPGTTYRVTTVATNSGGDGTTSTTSTFTTPLAVTTSTSSASGLVGSAITPISTSISGASPTNTTYSVSGPLPAGLSLDTATGTITGTPTIAVGSATYTITATTTVAGGATATGSTTLTLGVSPTVPGAPASVSATATASTTASVMVGAATYNGGAAIDSYTVTISPVVSGATGTASPQASAIGSAVSVTGLTPGTEYSVSVVATNIAGSGPATTSVSTIITPSALTPSISTTNGSVGNAITPITVAVTASGAVSTVFSITGPLPAGLTLDTTTGTISGTSTVAINPTQFTISAITTLASGATTTGTSVITLGIAPVAPSAPAAATATVPTGSSTTATISITAPTSNGGDPVDTYTVTATPVLAGVNVTTTTTTQTVGLTGLAPGTQYTAVVTATNSAGTGPSVTTSTFITNPVISLSSSSVNATVNSPMTPVTTNLGAEAGATAVYSISGTLPAGLSFDTATGTISGTPTTIAAATSHTITAAVTIAGVVLSASESVTVSVIAAVPTAPLAAVPSVPTGSTTTATLAITAPASNGGANITGYAITVIAVATGATISETSTTTNPTLTGLAAGTEYIATVAAINSSGIGATTTTASFVTNPGLTVSTASTTGAVGSAITPITTTLLAQAGTTATYSITGTLPAGLNFDISTGVISGTPTETSTLTTYTITATASIGGNAVTASVDVSLGVSNSLQANLVLNGSNATVGTPVALSLSGGSGTGAITYAITGGTATGCAVTSSGSLTATGAGTCIVTATKEGDNTYATAVSNALTVTFTAGSAPAPSPAAPTPSAPAPIVVTPTPSPSPSATPSPSPSASPSAKPTPTPSPSATPKPSPSASPQPTTSPKPTNTPKASPKPSPTPTSTPKATPKATPSASSSPLKKPLEIAPPKNSKGSSKSSVTVNNIKPGQKIKVTVVEGNSLPSAKPSSKVKPTPKPTVSPFKITSNAPTKVNPKPSGNSAGFGVNNLKPGQKIKVTIKTGGTKK